MNPLPPLPDIRRLRLQLPQDSSTVIHRELADTIRGLAGVLRVEGVLHRREIFIWHKCPAGGLFREMSFVLSVFGCDGATRTSR